jgi:hypothetical protein
MSPQDGDDSEEQSQDDDVASMYNQDEKVGPADVPGPDVSDDTDDGDTAETTEGNETADGPDEPGTAEGMPGEGGPMPGMDAPLVSPGDDEPEEVTGKFYVKYAQEKSVTLHDVDTAQICTLVENPGFERHEIVEATIESQPPMGVSYLITELDAHYAVPVEESPEAPTQQVLDIAVEELGEGDAVPIEREGKGEIHILRVGTERVEQAIEDLLDDETTYKNAARFENVERVEIRSASDEGVISVRYLP